MTERDPARWTAEPPSGPRAPGGGLLAALDDRLGAGELLGRLRRIRVPGGARWTRVSGAALLALLALQAVTGVGLACFYSPGVTTAWGSVFHIEERVLLGSFLRGLHATGASALVLLLLLHVLRAGLTASYRRPREATWLLGLLTVPVVLAMALTGYLLPWDQKGYWATRVATGIAAATPLIGAELTRVIQGGSDLGNLTLTRFFAAHAVLLPAALALLLGAHFWLLRRHGLAPRAAAEGAARWWPRQAARDGTAALAVVGVVAGLAAWRGAGLEAPADPTSVYPPRPEWYFSPLRQLLLFVPEPLGSHVIPGLVLLALAALPWLDRAERPRRRLARAVLLVPLAAAVALGVRGALADAHDPAYQDTREEAAAEAALAKRLARDGIPAAGAGELLWRHPPRRGARLFAKHCQTCHPLDGVVHGEQEGPDLTGYLTRDWLVGVTRNPREDRFFGTTDIDFMDPLPRDEWEHLPALAAYLESQDPALRPGLDPALVKRGEEAYFELECHGCHSVEPGVANLAPNLHGYGTEAWLVDFLRDPGQLHLYAEDNEMPAYADELTAEELRALAVFLRGLSGRASPEADPNRP